jgi:hypothetical protein
MDALDHKSFEEIASLAYLTIVPRMLIVSMIISHLSETGFLAQRQIFLTLNLHAAQNVVRSLIGMRSVKMLS